MDVFGIEEDKVEFVDDMVSNSPVLGRVLERIGGIVEAYVGTN